MDRSTESTRRVEALESEVAALRIELLAVAAQVLTLQESVAEGAHLASRLLAVAERTRIKADQLH